MPHVKIELASGRDTVTLLKIRDLVMDCIVNVLQLPADDRNIRIIEYNRDLFVLKPPYEILIEIAMFSGRTKETKRKLFKTIVTELEENKLAAKNQIMIVLNEQPPENWGVRGGIPADELDLGFKINI